MPKLCCLCCKPCLNECNYLQNDLGECNEVYETTVKYFDPMLLAEYINSDSEYESCVLCKNCWSHIQTFHDFQETVMKGRTSLHNLILQKSSLELKEIQATSNLINNTQSEKFAQLSTCENKTQFVECIQHLKGSKGGDFKAINKSRRNFKTLRSNSESNNEINDDESKCKLLEKKHLHKQEEMDDGANLSKATKYFDSHPTLDKGREYDKFIAEWKSQLECDVCNEVFPIFDILKVHFKDKHNMRGFVKCCDRKFDRRCSLVEHIRLHINPEMHKCDICGKVIGSKYSLIHHKKTIHEESKTFQCSKCPKLFKQKQNLKCHLLTHVTGNKDFKCNECDKAYVLEIQLKKHIKLVHIDNRVCDQCGKTLHGIGALKNHLKEHDNIEKTKFPCDECGAELGSRITLKRHKASYHNDGTTVYVCGICGKVSTTERALKNHKNFVHEKERKFKCPNCDKAFKRTQNLQEHIATHTGEALYQCAQCPKTFKISSKYHEHRKKVHPIEWEEGRKNRLEKQKIDFERVKNQVVL